MFAHQCCLSSTRLCRQERGVDLGCLFFHLSVYLFDIVNTKRAMIWDACRKVQWLNVGDCAVECNSFEKIRTTVNAIHVIATAVFERFHLVTGRRISMLSIICPCVFTPSTAHRLANSRFFFHTGGTPFFLSTRFCQIQSNLAEYPCTGPSPCPQKINCWFIVNRNNVQFFTDIMYVHQPSTNRCLFVRRKEFFPQENFVSFADPLPETNF